MIFSVFNWFNSLIIRNHFLLTFDTLGSTIARVAPSEVNDGSVEVVGNNLTGGDESRPRSCANFMIACLDDSGSRAGIAGNFCNKRCNKSLAVFYMWSDKDTSGNGIIMRNKLDGIRLYFTPSGW